jgi:hypothetical protein
MMMTMEEVVLNLPLQKKVTNPKKAPRMDPPQEVRLEARPAKGLQVCIQCIPTANTPQHNKQHAHKY